MRRLLLWRRKERLRQGMFTHGTMKNNLWETRALDGRLGFHYGPVLDAI